MFSGSGSLWKIGLIPQAVANGLAGILVLLFLISNLKGGLLDIGLVTGLSALALIPSQMIWGKLIDGTGRCKPFLVFGFVGMGVSLAAIPSAGSVAFLLVLVSLKSFLYAATLPARQLLTVESERREGWRLGLANMQFLTTLGETIGMGIGALAASSLGYGNLFLLCGVLSIASAAGLGLLAHEPGLMIQRRLVAMERSTSTLIAVSDLMTSPKRMSEEFVGSVMKQLNRSTSFLMLGILGFTLAGSALFSPLPAYFLQFFSSDSVFLLFFGGSLTGTICYLLVGRMAQSAGKSLALAASMRMLVIPLLLFAAVGATPGIVVGVVVLSLLEAFWSLFDVSSMFAFLETAQVGKAGFYGALVGLGTAAGGFLGGVISMQFGFTVLFAICSVVCAVALFAFVMQFGRS